MLRGRRGTLVRTLAVVGLAVAMMTVLRIFDARPETAERNERLYFPSGQFLKESTLGFREAAADYLWFRFIQYYGGFAKERHDLRYMDQLVDGITQLDPKFVEAYHFASLVKWSSFGEIPASFNLLKRGILANPESAKLHFQVGFMHYVVANDFPRAAMWFEQAGKCPDVTDRERRFAAFARYRAGDDAVSLELWRTLHESTSSPQMKDLAWKMIEKLERKLELRRQYGDDFIGPIPEI